MKRLTTILFLSAIFITSHLYSQNSRITIFQNTNRLIESFKKISADNSVKQIYIKFELDYSTSGNYSGAVLKYIKHSNRWISPYNNFLANFCSVHPPSQICLSLNFFMTAPEDTNYILTYRPSSWASDPDARTFLSTNSGVDFSMYQQFACGGTMLYPIGGDINADNSVWIYSYPVLFSNYDHLIYKSTDRGENWLAISQVHDFRTTSGNSNGAEKGGFLKISPFNNNFIFAAHRDYTALSTNGGVSFNSLNIPPSKEMAFDFSDSTIYSAVGNKFYSSHDRGLSWDSSSVSFQFNAIEISPDNSNIIYAGSPDGVYRTTDKGQNWYLYNNTFPGTRNVIGISKDINTGDTIIVCTNFEVYKVFRDELVGINPVSENVISFRLNQNYPNPFNPRTIINYELGVTNFVKLNVYDVLGNEIATLINQRQNAGSYDIEFDGSGFASGIYFYKLETGEFSEVKKMTLIK